MVKYYINLTDIMFQKPLKYQDYHDYDLNKMAPLAIQLSNMLAQLIQETLGNFRENTKVVIPTDSNFLFGIKVSDILGIPFVKMRLTPKILMNQRWDGILNSGDNVIIVHDVLVTGSQILDTMASFPGNMNIYGLFCLIQRTDYQEEVDRLKDISIYSLLKLSDQDIDLILENKENESGYQYV